MKKIKITILTIFTALILAFGIGSLANVKAETPEQEKLYAYEFYSSKNRFMIKPSDQVFIVGMASNAEISLGTSPFNGIVFPGGNTKVKVEFTPTEVILSDIGGGRLYTKMTPSPTNPVDQLIFSIEDFYMVLSGSTQQSKWDEFKIEINGTRYDLWSEADKAQSYRSKAYETGPMGYRLAITGQENFVTNWNDPKPIEFFQQFLLAWDESEGDISDQIYIKEGNDNYTDNRNNLGIWKVTFSVEDSSGNEANLEVYIRVVDIDPPIISGDTSTAEIGYKETWNITSFKNSLNITDNHDDLTPSAIVIKSDGYTSNKTTLGTYNVVFEAEDASGNVGTFTKKVKVIDNVKPTFSGPTTIHSHTVTMLSESEIRSRLTAYDEIDGNVTSKITKVEDNYTGNAHIAGEYTIKYSVTDNGGNTEYHIVTIYRQDDLPPVFYIVDGVSIITDTATPISLENIIAILTKTGQVVIPAGVNAMFNIEYDDYTGNENQVGVYTVVVGVEQTNGDESIHTMSINVLESESDGTLIENPAEFFKKYKGWIIAGVILLAAVIGYVYFNRPKRKRRY